jgi:MFS family permease
MTRRWLAAVPTWGRVRAFVRGYDRRLWVLFTVQLIVSVGFGAAMPYVGLYLYDVLGVPMGIVGTIMLVAALTGSAAQIMGGEIADRAGRRPLIAWTMGLRALVFLLMAYVVSIRASYLIVAAVFLGIRFVGAMNQPAISSMVADIVPTERRVEAFGILRIGGNAGWAIGPAIGGFLVASSYASLFILTAVASAIGLAIVLFFVTETIPARETEHFSLHRLLDATRDRPFLSFCGASLLLFLVMGQFGSTLSVYTTSFLGISTAQLGFVYTLNGALVVLVQWPAALLGKRIGVRRALVIGSLLFAAGYFSVGIVPGFAFLMGSMTVITLGEVLFSPSATSTVAELAPAGKTGRYMGLFGLSRAFGWSGGPFIGGWLLEAYGRTPVTLWGIIAAIGIGAAAWFFVTARRTA